MVSKGSFLTEPCIAADPDVKLGEIIVYWHLSVTGLPYLRLCTFQQRRWWWWWREQYLFEGAVEFAQ